MTREQQTRLKVRAQVLKAIAHPSRLLIIEELARQERCVNELTAMVGADMSTVSKHLTVLKNVGLIEDDKRGTMVYYRLRTPCIQNVFACVERALQERGR